MYHYREIFKQAAKVAFKYPAIWFFGLMAALLGTSGEAEVFFSSYANSGWLSFWQNAAAGGLFSGGGLRGLTALFVQSPAFVVMAVLAGLIVLGMTVFITWLVVISQTAVIGQSIAITRKHPLTWGESFGLGVSKFWPILGLNVVLKIVVWLTISIIGVMALQRFVLSLYVFIVVFNAGMILVLMSSFISRYAICAVVLKDKSFGESLSFAWKLFKTNWLMTMEISIILFLVTWVVNTIIGILGFFAFFYIFRLYSGWLFGLILLTTFLFVVFVVLQIALTVFSWATWAIIFEIISSKKNLLASRLISGWQALRR
ncbi:MAG: hypothetical protein HUU49_04520 [Candidatus Buchananbacteria bacterium]|nr:hypothetical protein [Candidatus Buchananbacteria bacterium]